jgi:putative oxidoreductase
MIGGLPMLVPLAYTDAAIAVAGGADPRRTVMDSCSEKYRDAGLLVLRVGIGGIFVLHGYPKIAAGPEMWAQIGGAMGLVGVTFAPVFWGFMASFAEFGGGLLVALGLFTRLAAALMMITMAVATVVHWHGNDDFGFVSHPLKCVFVFLSLLLMGPGRYALDACIPCCRRKSDGGSSCCEK